jgi:hypothetical protein
VGQHEHAFSLNHQPNEKHVAAIYPNISRQAAELLDESGRSRVRIELPSIKKLNLETLREQNPSRRRTIRACGILYGQDGRQLTDLTCKNLEPEAGSFPKHRNKLHRSAAPFLLLSLMKCGRGRILEDAIVRCACLPVEGNQRVMRPGKEFCSTVSGAPT